MVLIIINSNFLMRISLLGSGKTGRIFHALATQARHDVEVFSTSHRPDHTMLGKSDIIVCFVPGHAMSDLIPVMLHSGRPVLNGTTGFVWPESQQKFSQILRDNGLLWLSTGNFSPGCHLAMQLIQTLGSIPSVGNFEIDLIETHHIHKKDAPSGTALMWKNALGMDVSITSIRDADIPGIHEIRIGNELESVIIRHEVKDRSVFASGALNVAEWMHRNQTELPRGLHDVHELMSSFQHLK